MNNVCDCCKKEKDCIRTKKYHGETIGYTEVHLCSKCYKNTLQVESEKYNDPEVNYPREDSIYPCDYE